MNLLARLFVYNFAGLALVVWAYLTGILALVVRADPFHITYAIGALFIAGLAYTFWRALQITKLPTRLTSVASVASARRSARKAAIKNMAVSDVIESLAMLGIVGSALGLMHAFGGIDKSALASLDGLKQATASVLVGVSTLAGATFAGVSLSLWTIWNNRMLETATALYAEDLP